jgi:predicted transcriptional regulator
MAKKNYTWKLESDVVDKLQLLADKEHRSLTNYVEWLFMNETKSKLPDKAEVRGQKNKNCGNVSTNVD